MPKKSQPNPSALAVVRRFRATGECPELGIHCIPLGFIEVEELSDGTFRMADDDSGGGESQPLSAPSAAPSEPDAVEPAPAADTIPA